jgi:hypothetical protein
MCKDLHTIQHEYRPDIRYGPEKLWPLCTLVRRGQLQLETQSTLTELTLFLRVSCIYFGVCRTTPD